jgi:hypothetical protein
VPPLGAGQGSSVERRCSYLAASGAPGDYRAAIFAYNHADWYVADVLAKAAAYRGALRGGGPELGADPALLQEILANRADRAHADPARDLRAGGIDPRLLSTLAWIGRHHSVVITALRADRLPGTNQDVGRAMDIGAVDGEICRGGGGEHAPSSCVSSPRSRGRRGRRS